MGRKTGKIKVSKRTGLKTRYEIRRAGSLRASVVKLKKRSAIQAAKNAAKKTGRTYYVWKVKPEARVKA